MRLLVVVTMLLLAGCASEPEVESADDGLEPTSISEDEGFVLPAVGTRWTYETYGQWDAIETITVVFAQHEDGFVLGAEDSDQMVDEVAWNRLYWGPVDESLNLLSDDGQKLSSQLLQLPLENGTTWELYGVNLEAQAAPVTWGGTTEPGFHLRGVDGDKEIDIDIAPSVGFVSRFEVRNGENIDEGLRLVAHGKTSSWTYPLAGAEEWYTASTDDFSSFALKEIEVTDEVEVIVWGIGSPGTQVGIIKPDGSSWGFEGDGEFVYDYIDAIEGTWHFGGFPTSNDAWIYLSVHAVEWIGGTVYS